MNSVARVMKGEEPARSSSIGPVVVVEIVPDGGDRRPVNKRREEREASHHLVKRKRGIMAEEEEETGHRREKRSQGWGSSQMGSMPITGKQKMRIVSEDITADQQEEEEAEAEEQAFNAAQILYELYHGVSSSSSAIQKTAVQSVVVKHVHWVQKMRRSSRTRKSEFAEKKRSDSFSTSCFEKPPVLDVFPSYSPHIQVLPTAIETMKQEQDTVTEERSGVTAGGGMDPDSDCRLQKPVSESSHESVQPDLHAESPSSPLPVLNADASLIPKLEEDVAPSSAFQQHVRPLWPVSKKLSVLHKPKVVENITELANVGVAPNLIIQRKPRPSQYNGPLVQVKAEDVGLELIPPLSVLPNVCGHEAHEHPGKQMGSEVKSELASVKLKGRQWQRSGAFASGKLKPAISEEEKEARRLRRVQANRESARQTIRRKQMLCEQLVQKAASLLMEKEDLKQKLELQSTEYRALLEMNHHLKEQASLYAANDKRESPTSARLGSVAPSLPMAPYMRPTLPKFWLAFALAQVTAASQASGAGTDKGLGSDYSSCFAAATMAGTATPNSEVSQDVWRQSSTSLLPSAAKSSGSSYIGHQPTVSAVSAAFSATHSTSQPSRENVDAPIDGEVETLKNCMGVDSVRKHNLCSLLEGAIDNSEKQVVGEKHILCSPLEGTILKSEEHIVGSSFQLGGNFRTLYSALPQSLPVTGMGQPSFSAEGRLRASSSLHLVDNSWYVSAGQTPNKLSELVNPCVFSSFAGVGASFKANCGPAPVISGAAAAATEARRRRRELKRSRSLQSHQGA